MYEPYINHLDSDRDEKFYNMTCHVCGEPILNREAIAYEYAGQDETVHESCYYYAMSESRREFEELGEEENEQWYEKTGQKDRKNLNIFER
ncbi:hypothetical protein B0U03_02265 [Listeria monocytogenes]|nr:hypothetical protein [Listeria monocytogenes]EAE9689106.1 hypothetical protein [Listeria monocytogenes]EAE9692166.1 hypothetical protein [Listeria monocytogenes]EAE9694117.1 hypothetical protein [Listeria monocytogenes]EAE9697666.1 hypothetical protein [Listeria monocytogenes]